MIDPTKEELFSLSEAAVLFHPDRHVFQPSSATLFNRRLQNNLVYR
jgi:hypothetical protein